MDDSDGWKDYLHKLCYPVEKYLIGFSVKDRERLISAIISNAFLNEKLEFDQLKQVPADPSLETIGDFLLDFVIIDNFATEGHHTAKEIDDLRQFYGGNNALHFFKKKMHPVALFYHLGPGRVEKKDLGSVGDEDPGRPFRDADCGNLSRKRDRCRQGFLKKT